MGGRVGRSSKRASCSQEDFMMIFWERESRARGISEMFSER